jgi:hypothetical protein
MEQSRRDDNGVPTALAQDSTDATQALRLQINPVSWELLIEEA